MIYVAVFLLLVSILFLCIEIFIPGFGFFGICGSIGVFAAFFLTAAYVENGIYILAAEAVFTVALLFCCVKWLKYKKINTEIILRENLNEDIVDYEHFNSLVGKTGKCKTPLKPFGRVEIDGELYEASSEGDFIGSSESIKVLKIYENKIYVRRIK